MRKVPVFNHQFGFNDTELPDSVSGIKAAVKLIAKEVGLGFKLRSAQAAVRDAVKLARTGKDALVQIGKVVYKVQFCRYKGNSDVAFEKWIRF